MGLSGSKHINNPSSIGAGVRRSRLRRGAVLKSGNDETRVSDSPREDNGQTVSRSSKKKSGCCQVSAKRYRKNKADHSDDINCTTSDYTCGESIESNTSTRPFSSRSLNPRSRFLSRFSFYPGNLSFRLTRANRLHSTRARSASSTSYTISNEEESHETLSTSLVNRNDRPHCCDFFPACFSRRSLRMQRENWESNEVLSSPSSPDFFDSLQHNRQINSVDNEVRNRNDTNVQFRRTLSVGRLRDRVLRRMPVSDSDLYNYHLDGEVVSLGHGTVDATPYNDNFHQPDSSDNIPSSSSISSYGRQNNLHEMPRARETRYHDLLENRPNFDERRRRIRSQARALRQLGSRFENLPAHATSCTLSGQHRPGHCTCGTATRDMNSDADPTSRASISRVVMLAEALFEVLDQIHQQSVVLSSGSSVSSIGSIPAPNEVVDSLPVKIFSTSKKKPIEEATQCYICLVEYEEGDSMRTLPCDHEFHTACVDKWLKEIHRICPCCRGDICKPELLTKAN